MRFDAEGCASGSEPSLHKLQVNGLVFEETILKYATRWPQEEAGSGCGARGRGGEGSLQQAPGLGISLLWGRAGLSRLQLLKHHRWERTRGALRAPPRPYLSRHLLLGLAPSENAGVVPPPRNGVSCPFWCRVP